MPLHQALIFTKEQVQKAISSFANIPTKLDLINKEDTGEGVYVSLLYTEEEKTLKNTENVKTIYKNNATNGKIDDIEGYSKYNPKVYLNLYVLIASCVGNYEEGLKHISSIIKEFQAESTFKNKDNIEKITYDLHTLTFEQNASLWQTIGTKLYPYVVYKVRVIAVSKETEKEPTKAIGKVVGYVNQKNTNTGAVQLTEEEKAKQEEILENQEKRKKGIIIIESALSNRKKT